MESVKGLNRVKNLVNDYYSAGSPAPPSTSSSASSAATGGGGVKSSAARGGGAASEEALNKKKAMGAATLPPSTASSTSDVSHLRESGSSSSTGLEGHAVASAKDLDSPNFNVDAYVADLLRSTTFMQLLDKDEELVKEVKSLDASVQTMVYNNYSKFIGATETMKQMKDKLFKMESEVAGTEGRMDAIATATRKMNERNAAKRTEVRRLDRLGTLMSKLTSLFELPMRIRSALDLDEIDRAVTSFNQAAPFLLRQAETIPSFANVHAQCKAALEDIKLRLNSRLGVGPTGGLSFNGTSQEFSTLVAVLLGLGESRTKLVTAYFQFHRDNLLLLTQIPKSKRELPFDQFAEYIGTRFIQPLVDVCNTSERLFSTRAPTEGEQEIDIAAELALAIARDVLRFVLARFRERFDDEPSRFRLTDDASPGEETTSSTTRAISASPPVGKSGASSEDLGAVSNTKTDPSLHPPPTPDQDEEDEAATIVQGIGYAVAELRRMEALPKYIVRVLRLQDRGGELGERVVRRQVNTIMAELRRRAAERLAALSKEESAEAMRREALDDVSYGLLADAKAARVHLQRLLTRGSSLLADVSGSFEDVLRFQLQDWCMWLHGELKPKGAAVTLENNVSATRVALARRAIVARNTAARADALGLVDAKAASQALRNASDEALRSFVTLTGLQAARDVCRWLQQDAQALMTCPRPSAVSNDAVLLVREVVASAKLLAAAGVPSKNNTVRDLGGVGTSLDVPTLGSKSSAGGSVLMGSGRRLGAPMSSSSSVLPSVPGAASSGTAGLHVDISRMFQEKLVIFSRIEFDRDVAVTAALKVALKTWLEAVREATLGRHAYQQVQLDSYFVRTVATLITRDVQAVNKIAGEVLQSAADRCADPVPLEPSLLETLCGAKRDEVFGTGGVAGGGSSALSKLSVR